MSDERIQANEREIAELREQNKALQNQLSSLWSHERWLTNLVSRLSQRIEVIESVSHISASQRNTEIRGMDETKWRVV